MSQTRRQTAAQKLQKQDKDVERPELSESEHEDVEDGDSENETHDGNTSSPSTSDVMKAIQGMEKRITEKIDGVLQQVKDITERVEEAEERISGAEDEVTQLKTRVNTLESQVKLLLEKMDEMENRSRRNNVRIVGLPEKEEGRDACKFLESWIPSILEMKDTALALERAHRIGPRPQTQTEEGADANADATPPRPRTLIMRFLNFRQKEEVLRAAKEKGSVKYKDEAIRFFPDVTAETHRKQRAYDGVRQKLRQRGIDKHRVVFPARLLLTYDGKTELYDTPTEVEQFMEGLGN